MKTRIAYIIVALVAVSFAQQRGSTQPSRTLKLPRYMTDAPQPIPDELKIPDAPKTARTLDCFHSFGESTPMVAVVRKCGVPDELEGSGIGIFIYKMADGSVVAVGTPDLKRLLYVDHITTRSGTHLLNRSGQQWQRIDQLCGQLQSERSTSKEIIVKGKREKRLYETYVQGATLELFPAVDAKGCCGSTPIATVPSGRFGSFEFSNVPKGQYWLRATKGALQRLVPLRVTEDFDARACHDLSAGRSVVIDSNPPRVELRIR